MSPFSFPSEGESISAPAGYSLNQPQLARRLFLSALAAFAIAGAFGWAMSSLLGQWTIGDNVPFPLAFVASTALLVACSLLQHNALVAVRREKQIPFRRSLRRAATCGTLFVGVQGYGLWCMLHQKIPEDFSTGANTFVFVFAFLHAMHVSVAMLFLLLVAIRAHADRYDHEYYWGVTGCSLLWHFLGVVWLAILCVFGITA